MSNVSPAWSRAKNLIIGRFERISDFLLAEPTLAAVRENLPAARITLWTSAGAAPVAPLVAADADVLVTPGWQSHDGNTGGDAASGRPAPGDEVERLRGGAFDAALLLPRIGEGPQADVSALRLADVPLIAAQLEGSTDAQISDPVPPLPASAHQVHRNLHLIEALGFRIGRRRLSIEVSPGTSARTARLLAGLGLRPDAGYVVIEVADPPGAPSYPHERLVEVGRQIALSLGVGVVLVGDEEAGEAATEIARDLGHRAVSAVGVTSPATLAALLADALAYVGNATWPMYLAEALGTPGVLLWGGGSPRSRMRPRSPGLVLLRREVDCAACEVATCSRELGCLDLTPDTIASAVVSLVTGRADGSAHSSRLAA